MKKYFSIFVILAVIVAGVFGADSNRQVIDNFLDSYEDYVEAYEDAVDSENITDLMKLSQQSMEMAERCNEMQSMEGWTFNDSKRLLELESRLADAMEDDLEDDDFDANDFEEDDFDADSYLEDLEDFGASFNFSF